MIKSANHQHLKAGKVLIVDDYHLTCNMAAMFFAEFGYQCDIAGNVQDGTKLALENQNSSANPYYSMILIDLGLPDENGLSLVKKLRNHSFLNNTKIVIFTGNDDYSLTFYGGHGVDAILLKPCNLEKVKQLILTCG